MTPSGTEHACRVRCADLAEVEILDGPIPGIGGRVVCRVDGLGMLLGIAGAASDEGFRLVLHATPLQSRRLAGRLRWHREQGAGRPDMRAGDRIVTASTEVCVSWPDGQAMGTLRDVSAGGASVDVTPSPAIGTPVSLGRRRGTVVRHTELGIAVRFVLPLRPEDVTEDVVL
jgi:hypothetical protein